MEEIVAMKSAGSDQELLEACRHGERDALRGLFENHKNRVFSIACRFAEDHATAMDIAQDAFLKLFSCLRDFRGDCSFETWMYRIVVNQCLDHRRRSWRFLPLGDEDAIGPAAADSVLDELLRSERADEVRSAVGRLSPDLRIVIVLRYTEGMSCQQIAEALGCSAGAVGSRLHRAQHRLKRRLSHLARPRGRR